jgi:hypothetical protein
MRWPQCVRIATQLALIATPAEGEPRRSWLRYWFGWWAAG